MENKIVVVTGASSGIGQSIAHACAEQGASVLGLSRRAPENTNDLVRGQVVSHRVDVTSEYDVAACFDRLLRVDVLVNGAGGGWFVPFHDLTEDDLKAALRVHVLGAFLCMKYAAPKMTEGRVVALSSVAARHALRDSAGYGAAKAALAHLTRVFDEEERNRGNRACVLTLGAVDTPIWDRREGFDRSDMLRCQDVARFVVDLLKPDQEWQVDVALYPPKGIL